MTLAGSKENNNSEYEKIYVEVVIEGEAKEKFFTFSLIEIREERLERANILLATVE